jgi:hypothetical protein
MLSHHVFTWTQSGYLRMLIKRKMKNTTLPEQPHIPKEKSLKDA